ncbi:MAG: FecR domain-containing protein [Oscillospiraceae bacterium]|nr:FecR domain-containing protein [Oscillospiraceae bacterium]
MKKRVIISCLLTIVLLLSSIPVLASETVVSRSLVVESVAGDSATMTRGTNLSFPVREGTRLNTGNTVSTGRASSVDIRLDDNSSIRMNASTKVDISRASRRAMQLTVVNGTIALNAETQEADATTTIRAGNTTMGLRGTLFTVSYTGGEMRTILLEGGLDIETPDGTFELAAGQVLEYSMYAQTDVSALDVTQVPDSFTLILVREHSEMLVGIGTITAEDAEMLDELILERQAEEAAREAAMLQARPGNRPTRNLFTVAPPAQQAETPAPIQDYHWYLHIVEDAPPPPAPEPVPVVFPVTYDLNNGSGQVPEQEDLEAGESFAAAAADGLAPPPGYTNFKEWNTQADGFGRAYAAGATVVMPDSALTLYAIWEVVEDGTAEAPFRISTMADLERIGTGDWTLSSYYLLISDIVEPVTFMISDSPASRFTGNFNGNGHTITVNINLDRDRVGLFSHVCRGGVVQNLTVIGYVSGGREVGGIIGRLCGTLIDSSAAVQVSGNGQLGGLVGFINTGNGGDVQNSVYSGSVTTRSDASSYGSVGVDNYS